MYRISRNTNGGAAIRALAERLEQNHEDLTALDYRSIVQDTLRPRWDPMPEGHEYVLAELLIRNKYAEVPVAWLRLHTSPQSTTRQHYFQGRYLLETEPPTIRQLAANVWSAIFHTIPEPTGLEEWTHIDFQTTALHNK